MALMLDDAEARLVAALQHGLPLVPRPYAAIGERVGLSEEAVIALLRKLVAAGVIKRLGVVVRHHELGYRANAMVVWDVPDQRVDEVAGRFCDHDFVTLCYRRPRRLPEWPYNLFCMVHGRERATVLAQVDTLAAACGLPEARREVLFSGRRFKQRGALYAAGAAALVAGGTAPTAAGPAA